MRVRERGGGRGGRGELRGKGRQEESKEKE